MSNFVAVMHVLAAHTAYALVLIAAMASLPFACSAEAADNRFVVAIDAGHGGNDLGTSGRRLHEKDVVLDVAKRLQTLIEQNMSDSVRVVMTRTNDTFVALKERAAIANDAEADLFVSIHVNSVAKSSRGRNTIKGASVYALGLHKSEANLSVAMAENSVIELEEDYTESYRGFDPNTTESYIIFELTQNHNMEQSLEMAALAQHYLVSHAHRVDREVRQAGFLVLWATKMPAVLVELDFMCNPDIEKYFGTDKGLNELAEALYMAINDYRRLHPRIMVTPDPQSEIN